MTWPPGIPPEYRNQRYAELVKWIPEELKERRYADAELAGINTSVNIETLITLLLKHRQIAKELQAKYVSRKDSTKMDSFPEVDVSVLAEKIRAQVGEQQEELKVITVDQQAWIKNQILTAINMALALKQQRRVQADDFAFLCGIDGIAKGATREIIHSIGYYTEPKNDTSG